MEGKGLVKSVILGVLVPGTLVALLPQAQADAAAATAVVGGSKICCKDEEAKKCFYVCLFKGSKISCAATCRCVLTSGATCPGDYPASSNLLANKDDLAGEYCKLGCMSSVCGIMSSADGSEGMKASAGRCGHACGRLCDGQAGTIGSVDA